MPADASPTLTSLAAAWFLLGAIAVTGLLALCSLLRPGRALRLGLGILLAGEVLLFAGVGLLSEGQYLRPRSVQHARAQALQPQLNAVQAQFAALETQDPTLAAEQAALARQLRESNLQLEIIGTRRAQLADNLKELRAQRDERAEQLADWQKKLEEVMFVLSSASDTAEEPAR
jgi:septal ring factor EnvC (AmiA/AmiB activator)